MNLGQFCNHQSLTLVSKLENNKMLPVLILSPYLLCYACHCFEIEQVHLHFNCSAMGLTNCYIIYENPEDIQQGLENISWDFERENWVQAKVSPLPEVFRVQMTRKLLNKQGFLVIMITVTSVSLSDIYWGELHNLSSSIGSWTWQWVWTLWTHWTLIKITTDFEELEILCLENILIIAGKETEQDVLENGRISSV